MSGSVTEFKWTAKTTKAAQLVAADKLKDKQIAKAVGVAERTLERWKLNPEFVAKVNEIVERVDAAILKRGIANRARRVAILDDMAGRLLTVVEERAKEHRDNAKARKKAQQVIKEGTVEARDVPILPGVGAGGETGLLVRQIKLAASGATVEEFAVDTGLLKELRAHQEQAAKELGQWSEKTTTYKVDLSKLTDEQLERIAAGEDITVPRATCASTAKAGRCRRS